MKRPVLKEYFFGLVLVFQIAFKGNFVMGVCEVRHKGSSGEKSVSSINRRRRGEEIRERNCITFHLKKILNMEIGGEG